MNGESQNSHDDNIDVNENDDVEIGCFNDKDKRQAMSSLIQV